MQLWQIRLDGKYHIKNGNVYHVRKQHSPNERGNKSGEWEVTAIRIKDGKFHGKDRRMSMDALIKPWVDNATTKENGRCACCGNVGTLKYAGVRKSGLRVFLCTSCYKKFNRMKPTPESIVDWIGDVQTAQLKKLTNTKRGTTMKKSTTKKTSKKTTGKQGKVNGKSVADLLKLLDNTTDSDVKKRIRRSLRKLGHKGGLRTKTTKKVVSKKKASKKKGKKKTTGTKGKRASGHSVGNASPSKKKASK